MAAGGMTIPHVFTVPRHIPIPPRMWPPIENIPFGGIHTGEISAWRCWRCRVNWDSGCWERLCSVMVGCSWPTSEPLTAEVGQLSGIHAWKTRELADSYFFQVSVEATHRSDFAIIGQVALWGTVIEHQHGYRASHAKIVNLDQQWPKEPDILTDLRANYQLETSHGG